MTEKSLKAETDFGAKVPTELYEEFKLLFPQYGAVTWFINAVLTEFIEQVKDNGTLQDRVYSSIQACLEERRESR